MSSKSRTFTIGPGVECDLDRLVNTRLLIQANSGGGKSWALRRLLEQTHGRIQHLVIDPEGEFASLREKYDYVLAAKSGGDTAADPRTAQLLAEKLLTLGVSAILDIFELSPRDRTQFVNLFLTALVDAPKTLWHPVLVIVDEAHVYCPEDGSSESSDAVKALATRGRKRGFCAVFATQRLSKLAKDAAAECNNKLIGRTSIDVDMKRAADDLGLIGKEDRFKLRELNDGEFFAFGPALSRDVTRVRVGAISTTHPKAGSHLAAVVPPPTAKVRALLPQLSDLPAEAEARERSVADLKKENATLKRELAEAKRAAPPAPAAVKVKVEILTDADRALLKHLDEAIVGVGDALATRADAMLQSLADRAKEEITHALASWTTEAEIKRLSFLKALDGKRLSTIREKVAAVIAAEPAANAPPSYPQQVTRRPTSVVGFTDPARESQSSPATGVVMDIDDPRLSKKGQLKKHVRAILTVLAQHKRVLDRDQILRLANYTPSGDISTAFGGLIELGLVQPTGRSFVITADGLAALGPYEKLPEGPALREHLLRRSGVLEQKLLSVWFSKYPAALPRKDAIAAAGYKPSGDISTALGKFVTLGWLVETPGGLKASDDFFDGGAR